VDLPFGAWVLQNAANSAVGRLVACMAGARGMRTVNVVRRPDAVAEVLAAGGDVCLLDGADLAERVREATDGASIQLALDAVAGDATGRLATCVADEGVICVYGAMSGTAPALPLGDLVFRGVTATGFMLGRFLARHDVATVHALYDRLAREVAEGAVQAPIAATYGIEEIRTALIRAQSGALDGKVLVTPNGRLPSHRAAQDRN
jgi:NADPH:quinone reductase-like Zn-dependent oxidoreductase